MMAEAPGASDQLSLDKGSLGSDAEGPALGSSTGGHAGMSAGFAAGAAAGRIAMAGGSRHDRRPLTGQGVLPTDYAAIAVPAAAGRAVTLARS
jgi:hypothetical protein